MAKAPTLSLLVIKRGWNGSMTMLDGGRISASFGFFIMYCFSCLLGNYATFGSFTTVIICCKVTFYVKVLMGLFGTMGFNNYFVVLIILNI